jgi:hypothetical protein
LNKIKADQSFAWRITLGAFLCLALWPLWSARFPPMQDYPQHLAQAHMLAERNNPAFDYQRYFEFHLRPVYATFYLTTLLFSRFVPAEAAGKLALSLYPALVAVVIARLGRRGAKGVAPWGALLFFPVAFNQQYFMGNVNYILSLPLLVLALLDYEDLLGSPRGAWPITRQCLWQVALAVTHPFSFLAYVSLAVVTTIVARRHTGEFWRKALAPMCMALILLLGCCLESMVKSSPEAAVPGGMDWISPKAALQFAALMFTGMQWSGGIKAIPLILWGLMAAVVLGAMAAQWRERGPFSLLHGLWVAAAGLGFLVLPCRIGAYTGINLRLAPLLYFLIVLLVAQVRFRSWWLYSFVALAGLCLVASVARQARLSAETEEIVPILQKIPANSRILPLVFDRASPELDSYWFDPHLHDHNYYHVLRGGGFSPYLPAAQLNPVRYRPEQRRPAPGEYTPQEFVWEAHSADYQYFLVRGAPAGFAQYMAPTCNLVLVSGQWTLFERRAQPEIRRAK